MRYDDFKIQKTHYLIELNNLEFTLHVNEKSLLFHSKLYSTYTSAKIIKLECGFVIRHIKQSFPSCAASNTDLAVAAFDVVELCS